MRGEGENEKQETKNIKRRTREVEAMKTYTQRTGTGNKKSKGMDERGAEENKKQETKKEELGTEG